MQRRRMKVWKSGHTDSVIQSYDYGDNIKITTTWRDPIQSNPIHKMSLRIQPSAIHGWMQSVSNSARTQGATWRVSWRPIATLSAGSLLTYNLQPLGAWHIPGPLALSWVYLSVKIDLGGRRCFPKSAVGLSCLSIMTSICPASNEEQAIVRVSRSGKRVVNYELC